jgi:hypothetical protein
LMWSSGARISPNTTPRPQVKSTHSTGHTYQTARGSGNGRMKPKDRPASVRPATVQGTVHTYIHTYIHTHTILAKSRVEQRKQSKEGSRQATPSPSLSPSPSPRVARPSESTIHQSSTSQNLHYSLESDDDRQIEFGLASLAFPGPELGSPTLRLSSNGKNLSLNLDQKRVSTCDWALATSTTRQAASC